MSDMLLYGVYFSTSITVNLLTVLHLLFPKIVSFTFFTDNSGDEKNFEYVFKALERKYKSKEDIISRTIINCLMSILFIAMSLIMICESHVISRPFSSFDIVHALPFAICIGYCCFNVFHLIICDHIRKNNLQDIIKNVVYMCVLNTIVLTGENSLVGVIILGMYGATLSSEIKKVAELYDHKLKVYRVVLFVDILHQTIFTILVPLILYTVPLVLTKEDLFDMSSASLVSFFTSLLYFVILNSWKFKNRVYEFLDEYTKLQLAEKYRNRCLLENVNNITRNLSWKLAFQPVSAFENKINTITNTDVVMESKAVWTEVNINDPF